MDKIVKIKNEINFIFLLILSYFILSKSLVTSLCQSENTEDEMVLKLTLIIIITLICDFLTSCSPFYRFVQVRVMLPWGVEFLG